MAGKCCKIPRGQNPSPMWLTGIMVDCLEGPSGADVHDWHGSRIGKFENASGKIRAWCKKLARSPCTWKWVNNGTWQEGMPFAWSPGMSPAPPRTPISIKSPFYLRRLTNDGMIGLGEGEKRARGGPRGASTPRDGEDDVHGRVERWMQKKEWMRVPSAASLIPRMHIKVEKAISRGS